jgi:hypothetical protein
VPHEHSGQLALRFKTGRGQIRRHSHLPQGTYFVYTSQCFIKRICGTIRHVDERRLALEMLLVLNNLHKDSPSTTGRHHVDCMMFDASLTLKTCPKVMVAVYVRWTHQSVVRTSKSVALRTR